MIVDESFSRLVALIECWHLDAVSHKHTIQSRNPASLSHDSLLVALWHMDDAFAANSFRKDQSIFRFARLEKHRAGRHGLSSTLKQINLLDTL